MGEDKPANSVDKIPVILDTDIGMDVDDVWALVFLLCCPELDVKLITTATGDTAYRAALTAKILDLAGRADIPIGVGLPLDQSPRTHDAWLAGYQIADYPGDVLRDGVGALCDTVMASQEKVSIVSIGPVPNIAAALAREPNITANAKFIGMHGSLRRGYMGAEKPMREYNVKLHSLACQAVFQANWERLITPLDTCGTIVLEDGRFDAVQASDKLLTQIALQNHALWFEAIADWPIAKMIDPERQSSVLFDTAAVCLAFDESFFEIEDLPILITDDGKTLIDERGAPTRCATEWRDKEAFLDLLVERLA